MPKTPPEYTYMQEYVEWYPPYLQDDPAESLEEWAVKCDALVEEMERYGVEECPSHSKT